MTDDSAQHWEEQARNWIAWAGKPRFDSYWTYRDAFFDLVPAPGLATLDQGCGEGRVARDLAARGHRVTGVDASPTLVEAAALAHPEGEYLVADAAALPLDDDRFDLVIAYNVLMDVSDVDGFLRESARVLVTGGRLCLSITHPITNEIDRAHPYFESTWYTEPVERDGLTMVFGGWSRPLSAYTSALENAGFLVEAVREPRWKDAPAPYHLWLRALLP